MALLLTFLFHRETNADELAGEPLDAYTKNQLQGTHLDFIAETGRVITDENGRWEIVWVPPQLPTLEESISMTVAAKEANDTSLLPLCTNEYIQYLKEQKGGWGTDQRVTDRLEGPRIPCLRGDSGAGCYCSQRKACTIVIVIAQKSLAASKPPRRRL